MMSPKHDLKESYRIILLLRSTMSCLCVNFPAYTINKRSSMIGVIVHCVIFQALHDTCLANEGDNGIGEISNSV